MRLLILFLSAGAWLRPLQAAPTDGFGVYQDNFYVQNRTNRPMDYSYSLVDGMYTCKVNAGQERVEMHWDPWPNQKIEHLWEADVMFEPGSNHVCIMQIKSNTDGEPIYIQVSTNHDVHNSTGTPFLHDYAGKWFNLKTAFDPVSGLGRAWVDDQLMVTRNYQKGTSGWYFKNGTYDNGMTAGSLSVSHYRNIRTWIKGGVSAIRPLPPSRGAAASLRIYDLAGRLLGAPTAKSAFLLPTLAR